MIILSRMLDLRVPRSTIIQKIVLFTAVLLLSISFINLWDKTGTVERRPLRFSTICAKNQILKLKSNIVTIILRRKSPS
jgi:hypothetical protein